MISLPAYVDWSRLATLPAVFRLTRGGCEWVSFDSVAACERAGCYEDVSVPQTAGSNHAARVASLARMLRRSVDLDPLTLVVVRHAPANASDGRRFSLYFDDGSHRFRACEYLGLDEPLRVVLRGERPVLDEALALAGGAILA